MFVFERFSQRILQVYKSNVYFLKLSLDRCVECLKCYENRDDPRFKKFIWGANVSYHYKNCPFGCSTTDGKTPKSYSTSRIHI